MRCTNFLNRPQHVYAWGGTGGSVYGSLRDAIILMSAACDRAKQFFVLGRHVRPTSPVVNCQKPIEAVSARKIRAHLLIRRPTNGGHVTHAPLAGFPRPSRYHVSRQRSFGFLLGFYRRLAIASAKLGLRVHGERSSAIVGLNQAKDTGRRDTDWMIPRNMRTKSIQFHKLRHILAH